LELIVANDARGFMRPVEIDRAVLTEQLLSKQNKPHPIDDLLDTSTNVFVSIMLSDRSLNMAYAIGLPTVEIIS
jgi:hypothetical protein